MRKPSRGWIFILALALIAGCATQQATAYKTLGAVVEAVYTGMSVYGDEVKAGHVTPENQAKVKAAYEAYQTVIGAAIRTKGLSGPVPDDVSVAANALLTLLGQLGVIK